MSLENEIQLLKDENKRLKEELIKYINIVNNIKVGRTKTITFDIETEIIKLRQEGYTIPKIADIVRKSYGSVHAVLKKHNIEKANKSKIKGA